MLSSLRLTNFKCFRDITIPFRPDNVMIGRNNAGKSTIVEALRLIALVRSRFEHLKFVAPPYWTEVHPKTRGISPSLEDADIDFRAVFHHYGSPPAKIKAIFDNGSSIEVLLGVHNDRGQIHGILRDKRNRVAIGPNEGRSLGLPNISILPQVAPFNKNEEILSQPYVQRSVSTARAPLHFRNQINIYYQNYPEFRRIAEETWPGLRIIEFKGRGGNVGDPLNLLVQSEDFVAEVSWMGHGLQMWLQTMWFLARSKRSDIVMLDEPDVYMHPDLQRRLIRFLNNRFRQTIVTTHSVEILSEVEPSRILLVDKKLQNASFADSVSALQTAVDRLGATHNLQLSRLWTSRRLILVEGNDMHFLKRMHSLLFPDCIDSLDAIPNLPIGGWGGWNYAVGSAMLLENSVGELIKTYCILDSDFHTPDEIALRLKDAKEKHVSLHIWTRKEIESYLLVPKTIVRVIRINSNHCPTEDEVTKKLIELADSLRDEVHDCYADSFLMQDRPKGGKSANQKARSIVKTAWEQPGGALARVPPKSVLSSLSAWSKQKFGVSFGKQTILQEMRADEIDAEVMMVLTSIYETADFSSSS